MIHRNHKIVTEKTTYTLEDTDVEKIVKEWLSSNYPTSGSTLLEWSQSQGFFDGCVLTVTNISVEKEGEE